MEISRALAVLILHYGYTIDEALQLTFHQVRVLLSNLGYEA
jgi:hypothetical protein